MTVLFLPIRIAQIIQVEVCYMKIILVFILLSLFSIHLAADWSNIRNNSYNADNLVFFQYESSLSAGYQHYIYHYINNEWQSNLMTNISGNTMQGTVHFPNTETLSLSFRQEGDNSINIIPGYTSQQPTTLSEMTSLSEYERNILIPQNLNIAGEKMLFSDLMLFFALNNFGGGFPTSGGLFGPFYSYTINIWPSTAGTPPYVYTLLYTVNLAPYINPGLFKINAVTEEMTQIGSVTTQINQATNTLFISCLLSDLMNDPDFVTAYSNTELLNVSSLTQKIEDFGNTITIMDQGNYHNVSLQIMILEPFQNILPEISNILYLNEGGEWWITLDYNDQNGHFPIIREIELDNSNVYHFQPETFDFTQIVQYSCTFSDQSNMGTIRFSDNGVDLIEYPFSPPVLTSPVISAEIIADQIYLSWPAVELANSYKIFASESITPGEWGSPIAIVEGLEYTEPLNNRRFYRVIASTEITP